MELRSLLSDFRQARTFVSYKRKTAENWILQREKSHSLFRFNNIISCTHFFKKQVFDDIEICIIFTEVIDFADIYKRFSNRLKWLKIKSY